MDPEIKISTNDTDNFNKTPVPLSKSPGFSPSSRTHTQTVIVSLDETVTHDITFGMCNNMRFMYMWDV